MAKRSCGMRDLPMCGATVITTGDENLDASAAGERSTSGLSIPPLAPGSLVGLWATSGCSPKLSDGAIAKTLMPNPATIKANTVTLLMGNHPYIAFRAPCHNLASTKRARSVFAILLTLRETRDSHPVKRGSNALLV